MREYELGQLLVNDLLPEDMRDYNRVISKGSIGKLMTELAKRHPEQYKDVSHKLLQLGYQAAYLTNGDSFTLKDMSPTAISKKMQKELNDEVQKILYKAREKGIKSNDPKVNRAIIDACIKWSKKSDEGTTEESDFDTNALYRQAQKTGVGAQKPGTYKSIRTGDVLYVDQNNKPVPIPVTHSYAQGLRPAEYFAGAFGTRKGIVDLQKATQDAGYLSKQLVQIAHRLVVDSNDSDQPYDETNPIGYPSTVDDADNEGAMLSMPVGGYKRNTVLTPKILADLKQKGIKNILVRSVIAGGPANGGIYAYDAGIRETGSLPAQGDFVGIKSVQAISEPITQSAISSKHSGGVAGAESGKAISGFKYINQLIQVPKHFPGGATHATVDGKVERIRPAAQGGYYITVAGHDHYVRTDKGDETPILVKVGDEVEAGDVMSDGIPNPSMIVKYKGLGEGRRYFTNMFRDALDRAGTPVNRRNIETLSRGLISYVKLNSEIGDYSPDDILPYSMVAADYKPRDGYTAKSPKDCKGMYLEKPVLHYTIGTRITPKVIKELNDFNIKQVTCHKDPPPFESEMVRGMAHAATDPDWGTKMLGSYNKESLLESARLGAVSNTQGTSYVPALAFGDPSFGNTGATKQGAYELLKAAANASITPSFDNLKNNYRTDTNVTGIDFNRFFDENGTDVDPRWTSDANGMPNFFAKKLLNDAKHVRSLSDTYDKLGRVTNTNVNAPVNIGNVNTAWVGSDPAHITLNPAESSIYSLLHEKGHVNDFNNGHQVLSLANSAANGLTFGKYHVYNPNDLRELLNAERNATDYARSVVNKIDDKAVRDRAMAQLNAELIPAFNTYDKSLGRILRGHETGSTIGKYTGAGIGTALGGYAGYHGSNWLSKKLGLKGSNNKWKHYGDIALRTLGTAGGAALGGYGGYRAGDYFGGGAGQLYTQYMHGKDMDNDIAMENEKMYQANRANQDIGFLTDYLSRK